MVRRLAIPRHLLIGDFQVKISYAGQQKVCDLCAALGHIAQVCLLRGKCFQCGLEGHLSRNCPQRAEYRARDDAEKDVPDPTAAEAAARASGAPQDNQLNELSHSILAPVLAGVPPVGTEFPADNVSVESIDVDYSANGISNGDNQVAHIDNAENTVVDNDVNNNVVSNNMEGSNVANNNLVVNENTVNNDVVENNVVNSNLVVNRSTVNNNVVGTNGNNVLEISTSEYSAIANNNSMEEPNYSPVSDSENIVDPGSSSLCAFSLDSGDGNLVEPSSSALISSGASDVLMEEASDSLKRAHTEVSSDGDSLDSGSYKSKLPVRKQKGVRKTPAPALLAANPRASQSSIFMPSLSRGPQACRGRVGSPCQAFMRALFLLLMPLSLISINVNGLRDGNKRAGLLQFLRCLPNPPDVVCLQEVHCVSKAEGCDWFRSSGFSVLALPCSPRSCGCAILYKPYKSCIDAHGRLLHCSFSFADVIFNVACLYAPNRNPAKDHFFDYVLDVVNPDPPTILCGDFNTVFDRGLDRSGSDVDDSSRESTPSLIRLFHACAVVNIWSALHPPDSSFTWLRPNGSVASSIDLVGLPTY